jgi:hypothetical protein
MCTKKLFIPFFFIFFFLCFNKNVKAQLLMSTTGSNTQTFDGLGNSGTISWLDNSTIPNWYSQRTGVLTTYLVGTGSGNTGAGYNFGSTGSTDRALGSVGTNNVNSGGFAHGVQLKNTSGSNITDIKVSYTLEQWRNGGTVSVHQFYVYYKIGTSAITNINPPDTFNTPLVDINAVNGWTKIPALTLNTPVNTVPAGALDGNAAANKVSVSNISIPGLNLANNEFIMIKWDDSNHVTSDHGIGIDDVTISWTVAQTAANISPSGNVSICNGSSQTLTISGAATGATFQWKKDGVDIPGAINATYSANVAATYTCVLTEGTVVTTLGSVVLSILPLPSTPTITATPTTICSGGSIAFSTPAIAGQTYSWDFGDGSTDGAGTSVNHTYNLANTGNGSQSFTVTLTTTISATGCRRTNTQLVTVKQLPDAAIGDFSDATPFSICNGEGLNYIEVTNLSTSSNTNYLINWGDASANFTATGTWLLNTGIAAHNYTSSGYFILSFTVTGNNGCTNTKTYNIYKGSNPSVPFSNPGNTVNLCAPYTLTLPSQTATNPIGTVYIVTVNDGSPVETFTTLPAQYTHTFNTASCGASGGITPNTFYVTIRAQNPCGFSDFTVQPIAVSKKPIANFTISPDTIICKNEYVIITNTTIAGVTVNNNGVCNYTSPNNWDISPSTGWTLNSGNSLGDLFPDNDPSTWGSSNLGVTFNRSGTYVISNFVRNFCGTDTIKKTIYVNSITLSSFVGTDLQNVCINTPINNISYRFSNAQSSVTVSGLPTGVTGVYNSITKTFAISGTPSVSGVFNYTVSAVASCGDVNTVSGTIRSVIKPSILSSSFTNPIFCASTTGSIALNGLNLSTSYSVFYSYNSFVQTITLNSNSSGTINISNLPAGTYSNVYVVLNNCPSAPVGPVKESP